MLNETNKRLAERTLDEVGVFATHSGRFLQMPRGALEVPRGGAERINSKG